MNNNFKISYETNSYVSIGDKIKLNAEFIYNKEEKIKWKSLDPDFASVQEDGYVIGLKEGNAFIRAYLENDEEVFVDFLVTIVGRDITPEVDFILRNHQSNIFKRLNLGIGAGRVAYHHDFISSVSNILFNEELVYDTSFCEQAISRLGDKITKMESIEFITVHYTGNMRDGANARANSNWFVFPIEENPTSIHYVTGNDGIFKSLDEPYLGWHAGDSSAINQVGKFTWRKTGIKVLENDPKFPVVTINENANFSLNGIDTLIKVPEETKFGYGFVNDNKWLNKMGLGVKVIDNEYYLGTAWWCYTQVSEGRICSSGGNFNSIGIESCVNEGSDIWYTWQKTAMLVADIMRRNNLDITKVRGHHAFSAKNCPQPMLENNLELWHKFIELVEAEYERMTKFKHVSYTMTTNDDIINNVGRVTKCESSTRLITYKVHVESENISKDIILGSIV